MFWKGITMHSKERGPRDLMRRIERCAQDAMGSLRSHLSEMSIPLRLFCLALLLKPLYVLPSGLPQASDAVMLVACAMILVPLGIKGIVRAADRLLVLFLIGVLAVQSFYFFHLHSASFALFAAYYVFNVIVVLAFRHVVKSDSALWLIVQILRFDVLLQVVSYVFGFGRWYDAFRFMGTFNDPNQLGFFMLCAYVAVRIIVTKRSFKPFVLDEVLTAAAILLSASTGALAGMAVVFIPRIAQAVRYVMNAGRWGKIAVIACGACALLGVLWCAVFFAMGASTGIFLLDRVLQKVTKLFSLGSSGTLATSQILADRNLDKLVLYPELMLFGAGEGMFERFTLSAMPLEVHSTLPGILFYYGIVPFALLMVWIVRNLFARRMTLELAFIYAGFFLETFVLANQRQPLFWIIIALGSLAWLDDASRKDSVDA